METKDFEGRRPFSRKWFFFIPVAVVAAVFLFSLAVMLLWNAIFPAVFKLGAITLWQAMGILVLSKLLFGGFHSGRRAHPYRHTGPWRHRWTHMSEEDRTRMKEEWAKRCKPEPSV